MIKLALIVFLVISSVFSCETNPLLDYQNDSRGTKTVTFKLPTNEEIGYSYEEKTLTLDSGHNVILKFREVPFDTNIRVVGDLNREIINDSPSVLGFFAMLPAGLGVSLGFPCALAASIPLGCIFNQTVGWLVFGGCFVPYILMCPVSICIGCIAQEKAYDRLLDRKIGFRRRLSSITYPKSLDLHELISFLTTKGYINELDLESATHTK